MFSRKNWLATFLLCLFFGMFGAHRYYAGKIKTGLLWTFTAGICGWGWLIDLILILSGRFTDRYGCFIVNNPAAANRGYNNQQPYNSSETTASKPSTTKIVGITLIILTLLAFSILSAEITAGSLLFGIPVIIADFAYLWFFVILKMFREANIVKEDEVPNAFNPFKKKEDIIIEKSDGRYLGYEESLDGMYAEHYEAMQFYNNLKMYLEDDPHADGFHLGKVTCRRFCGKENPDWQESYFMFDMNGILIYVSYNDGASIYTYKKGSWYVLALPESQREPDPKMMF